MASKLSLRNILASSVLFLSTIALLWQAGWTSTWPKFTFQSPKNVTNQPRLHLLIPATRTNPYLCQLLISAAILDYPAPVLINWEQKEDSDDYVQHLAKIGGVKKHLESLPSIHDDDLVLMVDGYDVWFQLGPEILIDRYNKVLANLHRQNEAKFGAEFLRQHSIKDSVVFSNDKLCWPGAQPERAACWAVPGSTLPTQAFGPDTDRGITEHDRPIWLNSGSIMGPVHEVRRVFTQTAAITVQHPQENSDQFHFASIFGTQSYQRSVESLRQRQQAHIDVSDEEKWLFPDDPTPSREIPAVSSIEATDFHIGLDYESAMFQSVAFYDDYIAWIRNNRSQQPGHATSNPYDTIVFPADLRSSSPLDPYPASHPQSLLQHTTSMEMPSVNWASLPLATNTITKHIIALIHFTGKKGYRDLWWQRNWFYPYAQDLLQYRRLQHGEAPEQAVQHSSMPAIHGGQRSDDTETTQKLIPWEQLCGPYTKDLLVDIDG